MSERSQPRVLARESRRDTRRSRSAPTISDVARLAGVSLMTVSRVINGEPSVRPSTRDAVNDAIATLKYAPNPAARMLAGGGQKRFGLLYTNPSAGYLSELLLGGLDQASRSDIQIVVERCELDDRKIAVARHMIDSGVDGLILPSPLSDSPELLAEIEASGVDVVLVGGGIPVAGMNVVRIDEFAAAHAMTDHILGLGHRRIGFITGDPIQPASGQRLEGYQAALRAAGVKPDPALVAPGLFTYRSGLVAAEQLLNLADPPTAIFASNDDMAAATIAVAHRRGIDVPGALTVCGFDDTVLATVIWPELTTIRQPIADMARAAIDLLAAVSAPRRGRPAFEHRQMEFTLIRRQSDGPPCARA